MDFLDDTTRIDNEIEDGDESHGFFALPPVDSTPPSETLFLPEESDDEPVEVEKPPEVSVKRSSPSPDVARPTKRRRTGMSPRPSTSANTTRPLEVDYSDSANYFYIGEFLVDGAYSLVSGTNAIRVGEQVYLTRNAQEGDPMRFKSTKGKDAKGKGKQMTLTGFINQPTKPAKSTKKVDYIVRFTSQSGSHLGRLPVSIAESLAALMDGLARFSGSVIDAPERIRTGDSVLLSLKAYLNFSAFNKPNLNVIDEKVEVFGEGTETATEKSLRERKSAILKLFRLLGLKPRGPAPVVGPQSVKVTEAPDKARTDQPPRDRKPSKKEVIGEGEDAEEVEVDDDEEVLQEADIDMIYKKYDAYLTVEQPLI